MKKTLSIALLSFFLLHLVGFYVYFGIRQTQIRDEMRAKIKVLPADQLEIFRLTPTTYQQALRDGEDEIELHGKMYDIARIEVRDKHIVVYALHDSAEDNLLSFLDHVLKGAIQDRQEVPAPLFQFSTLTFVLPAILSFQNANLVSICAATNYNVGNSSFVLSLDTPPPRD